MTVRLTDAYLERIQRGLLERDEAQFEAVSRLERLAHTLQDYKPERSGGVFSFLRRNGKSHEAPRGLYIHGAVGRGKTMLMDLFYEAAEFAPKRRIHFHAFMAEAHDRIQRGRATSEGDPIPLVAAELAAEATLLCFDEMTVTDIADAMILGRLFKGLFEKGVVIVTTSNSPPSRLYWNGLNRQLFLPFIALIEEKMEVMELRSSKDFRLDKLSGRTLYYCPCDDAAAHGLSEHWHRLTGRHGGDAVDLEVKGRRLRVPLAAHGVARFSFQDLCGVPLGSLDYLEIARHFHTVVIDRIPLLSPDRRDEARRLIHLIDTLYDHNTCLIASADAEPHELYPSGDGAVLFERTASRLTEMRSEAYLAKRSDVQHTPTSHI